MNVNVKTHKTDNPARVTNSGYNTTVEHLSIFVEEVLFGIASDLPSRIKATNHILDIIGNLNSSNLCPEWILLSIGIFLCSLVLIKKMEIGSVI